MTETDKDGLLPCPFCGSAPVTTRTGFSGQALYIYCINDNGCPRPKAVGESKEKAVENWNSRYSVAEERLRTQLARAQANHKDAVEGKRKTDARLRVALKALQEIYDDIESDNRIIKIAGDAFNAATDDIAPADDIGNT